MKGKQNKNKRRNGEKRNYKKLVGRKEKYKWRETKESNTRLLLEENFNFHSRKIQKIIHNF